MKLKTFVSIQVFRRHFLRQGTRRNLTSIKLFGCSTFVHIEKNFRGKIDRTSQKGIFLGSSDNGKIYLVDILNDKGIFKVRKSRNISFNENDLFIEYKKSKEEIVNKHQSKSDRDSNPMAFLGEIVSKEYWSLLMKQ